MVSDIDEGYAIFNSDSIYPTTTTNSDYVQHIERTLNRSLIALRIAMNRMAENTEDVRDSWVAYEILMQHKNVLHDQIDILLKERRKLRRNRYL